MDDITLVCGRWVIADWETVIADGAVAVAGDTIREVGDRQALAERYPEAAVLGSDKFAVLPGLINAHHHSDGATGPQHGIPDLLLESWILTRRRRRPADVYLSTLLSAARLLQSGVTSVVDVHTSRGTADAYAERVRRALSAYDKAGIRVAFAAGIRDQSYVVAGPDADQIFLNSLPAAVRADAERDLPAAGDIDGDDYLALMDEFCNDLSAHPRIDVWFGPPGPQWVTDGLLQRIAEAAERHDTGVQTHVNESIYEKLYGPKFYGQDNLLHLRDLGLLGPRFSIAHGVWLSEAEIVALAETGAAVCHNPSSNLRLCAGIAPLNELLAAGATVALGMDGTTLNDDEDMFTEMRLALRLNRTPVLAGPAPSPADVFHMATAGGARLLRQERRLGKLAPGFAADLALVKLDRLAWPWVAPEADPLELVLMRARAGDVETVLVGGEVVLRDGQPTRFDVAEAGRELAELLAATAYPAAAAEQVARLLPHVEAYYRGWEMPALEPFTAYNSRR